MKKIIVLAVVFLGFAATSFAQLTAIANISASIQNPISITKDRDLSFGNVYTPSVAGGTVYVAPQETANSLASANVILGAGSGQAAKFTVIADVNSTQYLSLPNNTPISLFNGIDYINVVLDFTNISSAGTVLRAPGFGSIPSGAAGSGLNGSGTIVPILIDGAGGYVFYVGGTVFLAPNQAWGSYTNVTDMEFIINQ